LITVAGEEATQEEGAKEALLIHLKTKHELSDEQARAQLAASRPMTIKSERN
jgi:hypothetical protein